MSPFHSIRAACAAAVVAAPLAAWAQLPPAPPPLSEGGASTFTIFFRGLPIGSEQIATTRSADGWSIVSSGRIGAPIDIVARRVEIRYTADWRPLELRADATVRGQAQSVHTIVDGTTARTDVTVNGQTTRKSDPIDPAAILILPSSFFAPYAALAARMRTAVAGSQIPVYSVPALSFTATVGASSAEQIQTTSRMVTARRTHVTLGVPGVPLGTDLWSDEAGRMIRFSVAAQSLEVVREDIASVASRSVPISRPNDEAIKISGNGFSLAGTLSKPAQPAAGRRPAIVLVGGSGPTDRDGVAFGIPILGEMAGALADAGFIVVRYDKRGIGQSGGRAESASLADYAEDLRAAVRMLSQRKDVDARRIGVVGHSEGGAVALMAAAKDKRIAAAGLVATPGVTGAEIVLAQQKRLLDRSTMSETEKQEKVAAQKRIHDAVITGKGLDTLPPEVRRAVDTPEFQSVLLADPAKIMPNVRQPVLILQGQLDTQVEPPNADRLAELARQRKRPATVDVVNVPGVNHLLVPATTGEFDEYVRLAGQHVSSAVMQALVSWFKKTL